MSFELCRICLHSAGGKNLFSDDENSRNILEKIFNCFHIILSHEEHLPSIICINCIRELDCADKFRMNCVTFQNRFDIKKNASEEITHLNSNICKEIESTADSRKSSNQTPAYNSEDNVKQVPVINAELICGICNKILASKLSLSKHILSMHQNKKHVRSMTGHGSSRKYNCTKCPYSTMYSQTLVNHMRRHNGDRPYQCDCGKSFTQAASLATHQKIHSNILAHVCSSCGKQFRHAFSLKKHLLVHETAKFSCTICNKFLKTEYSLTAHVNRHYNIRNYSCESCGDTFITSTDLMNHRKKHSLEKNAQCHICNYKTRAKRNLILHIKRHAGDKSFECNICNKALYTQSDLRRHMRVHSHDKPYPCPTCAQRFSQPGSLNQHVRNLHGIKDYLWSRTQTTK